MKPTATDIAAIRFGYGLGPEAGGAGDADALIEALRAADPVPPPLRGLASAPRLREQNEVLAMLRASRKDKDSDAFAMARRERGATYVNHYLSDAHARLVAAVQSPCPLFERLVAFWSNHFTVSTRLGKLRPTVGPYEVEAIRPHVTGRFSDMLLAVARHPVMLIYLDQFRSVGPNSRVGRKRGRGLNENLAREIMELHTLGVDGGYSQEDVTELAKLLTGWTVDREAGTFLFRRGVAEPGTKRVLGRTFGGRQPREDDAVGALIMLAEHPATARHLATKLARHFVADDPPAAVIDRLATAWMDGNGELMPVYEALLRSPEAWDGFGAKVKTPYEFVVSGLRAAGVPPKRFAPRQRGARLRPNPLGTGALEEMSQAMWNAPGPDGWPDRASDWMTPLGLTKRLNWISQVIPYVKESDPLEFAEAALGSAAADHTLLTIQNASRREEGLALVLASPEFNRR